MVMFEPFIQWQWFLIFLLKKYISGQGLFPYMLEYTYIHRPISKTKQAKKVKTLSNEHRILKGTNCRNVVLVVQREKSFPKRKSAPVVSDHQRNGDNEEADHHEMDVKKAMIMMSLIVLRTWCTGWGGWRPARGRGRSRPGRGRRWGSRSWGDGSVWPWHHGGDDGGGVPERSGDLVLQALIWRSSLSLFLLLRLSRFN